MCHTVFSTCFSVHGGELFERIVAEEYLMEDDAVDYVKQILEALKFMHERHVVHLDLKVASAFLSVSYDFSIILLAFYSEIPFSHWATLITIYSTVDSAGVA